MKVWLVNPFDNLPSEGLRPQRYWLMAQAFVRAGHAVVYWSADFSHAYKQPRDVAALSGRREGIDLRLVHEPPYAVNICLKRLWSHWRFSRNWLAAARQSLQKGEMPPALVVVSSPPLTLAAAARSFCRRMGAKLIVDVQDAWPETFRRIVPQPLLSPLRALARRNYRAADAITAVARRYLELVADYGAGCPTQLCHLGIGRRAEERMARRAEAGLRLVYIGNMSRSYDLATVVEAVKELPDVSLDLAGKGPDEAALRVRAADCARIRFHGYLTEDRLWRLLRQADVGVIPMFDDSCVGVPGKLADYAAAGLPMINALTGETAELLESHHAGVRYRAGDKGSFVAAVAAVRELEKNGIHDLAVEFDAEKLYNSYVVFAEKIVNA